MREAPEDSKEETAASREEDELHLIAIADEDVGRRSVEARQRMGREEARQAAARRAMAPVRTRSNRWP